MSHTQEADFKTDQFKFEIFIYFDKIIPIKENATLRVYKNKTEKVSEYQIEVTKFIGEESIVSELDIIPSTIKPASLIVRAFKFKCNLQSSKDKSVKKSPAS